MKNVLGLMLVLVLAMSSAVFSDVPGIIAYQGRVSVGGTNFTGTGQFRFALVSANGAVTYWDNGVNTVSLSVDQGLFEVLLGDTAIVNMATAIPASVFDNTDVRLRVWFNGGSGLQLMTPDQRIGAVGYAMTTPNNSVTTAKLATDAVTSSKLADNSVNSWQISDGAVAAAELSSDAASLNKVTAGVLSCNGADVWLRDHKLYLRGYADVNHGLRFCYTGSFAWVNAILDGPILFGWDGGGLGTMHGPNMALRWNHEGKVVIDPLNKNNRTLTEALVFGTSAGNINSLGSGEGISSRRSAGAGQYSLDFYAGGPRRMSIANNGRVGIGRDPTANTLEVEGTASKAAAGNWLANSDGRIKTDVHTVQNALEMLDRVRLVEFRYTDDYRAAHPSVENRRYLNVVAQEFQQVFPDYVTSSGEKLADGSEILQVDAWPLTVCAAAAIQELKGKLDDRDAQITELQRQMQDMNARLRQMEQSR